MTYAQRMAAALADLHRIAAQYNVTAHDIRLCIELDELEDERQSWNRESLKADMPDYVVYHMSAWLDIHEENAFDDAADATAAHYDDLRAVFARLQSRE